MVGLGDDLVRPTRDHDPLEPPHRRAYEGKHDTRTHDHVEASEAAAEGMLGLYKQAVRKAELALLVGKVVSLRSPGVAPGRFRVVGWTQAVLSPPGGRAAERWGLIAEDGMVYYLMKGAEWEIAG